MGTVGNQITDSEWSNTPSQLVAIKFDASDPTFVASAMFIYINKIDGGSAARIGIYQDVSGSPGSLLAETPELTISPSAWNGGCLVSTLLIENGESYWLAYHSGNFTDIRSNVVSPNGYGLSGGNVYDPAGMPAFHGANPVYPGAEWAIYATEGDQNNVYKVGGFTASLAPYVQRWRAVEIGRSHFQRQLVSNNWEVDLMFDNASITMMRQWAEAASGASVNLTILDRYKMGYTDLSGVQLDMTEFPSVEAGVASPWSMTVRGIVV